MKYRTPGVIALDNDGDAWIVVQVKDNGVICRPLYTCMDYQAFKTNITTHLSTNGGTIVIDILKI